VAEEFNQSGNHLVVVSTDHDNSWFNNFAFPLLYKNYPLQSNMKLLGRQVVDNKPVDGENFDIFIPANDNPVEDQAYAVSVFPATAFNDLTELRDLAARYGDKSKPEVNALLNTPYKSVIYTGSKLSVDIKYMLPGKSIPSSQVKLKVVNL